MIKSSYFVSKKNYYLLIALNALVYGFYGILKLLRLPPVSPGIKARVLFIELAHLGDGLLLTPAIRLTNELRPDLEIICLVSPSAAKALMHNPHISSIEIIEIPWFNSGKSSIWQNIAGFQRLVKAIKRLQPETVVNFRSTGYHREHLGMFLAAVPQRIGFAHKGLDFLLTTPIPFTSGLTVPRQKVDLISYWLTGQQAVLKPDSLKPDFPASTILSPDVSSLLEGLSEDAIIIGINMSAQHNYLWPAGHFARLCKTLHDAYQSHILFVGTADFTNTTEKVRSQLGFQTISLVGKTSLDDMPLILKRMTIMVTVDTGIRHIANAAGIPVVSLRNSAERVTDFGKYVDSEEVITNSLQCSPCGKIKCPYGEPDCMTGITPERVIAVVNRVISTKVPLPTKGLRT